MRLRDMKPGVQYRAVTGGLTIYVGESLMRTQEDYLRSCDVGGFLKPAQWKRLKNRVKVDAEWCRLEIAKALEAVNRYQDALGEVEP